jgi:hypothetical protein
VVNVFIKDLQIKYAAIKALRVMSVSGRSNETGGQDGIFALASPILQTTPTNMHFRSPESLSIND